MLRVLARLNLTLDSDTFNRLAQYAQGEGRARSAIARELLVQEDTGWEEDHVRPTPATAASEAAAGGYRQGGEMPRLPGFIPGNEDGVLVEVTGRTIGAQALMVPAPEPRRFNEIVVGVMGRAQEVSPLELSAAVFTANHYHLLAVVHEQQELSRLTLLHFVWTDSSLSPPQQR